MSTARHSHAKPARAASQSAPPARKPVGVPGSQYGIIRRTSACACGGSCPKCKTGGEDLPIQNKVVIGNPGDPHEHEADAIADRVMRAPNHQPVANAVAPQVMRSSHSGVMGYTAAPPIVHEVLQSPGKALDPGTREFMESRLGRDLSSVRIHDDAQSAASASEINSLAYTMGNDIVFGAGRYVPGSDSGKRLLAHELAHVAQQSSGAHVVRREPDGGSDDPKTKPVRPPVRQPYGSTEISKKAIAYRRSQPNKSGDYNLVVVEFLWRKPGSTGRYQSKTKYIWNASAVAHSEQALDQYFRDFNGGKAEIVVQKIFSERQFCGPSSQNCQQLVYKSYPNAEKEFAYNYQMPPGAKKSEGETTRNVIRSRIEAFRDGKDEVDRSTLRDPPPYDEASGGRVPGQVGAETQKLKGAKPPAAKTSSDPPATAKSATTDENQPPAAAPKMKPQPAAPEPAKTSKAKTPPEPARASKTKTPPTSKTSSTKSTSAKPDPAPTTTSSGSGASNTIRTVSAAGKQAVGSALRQMNTKLTKIVRENSHDPDLNHALDALDKLMDLKALAENPGRFSAQAIKSSMIQGVFNHFSSSLDHTAHLFDERFPDVPTLNQDPLNTGISLETFRERYLQALGRLRLPDPRKVWIYMAVAVQINDKTPQEKMDRLMAEANALLARLPEYGGYVHEYIAARDNYNAALIAVNNKLDYLIADWVTLPRDLAQDLRRRGNALGAAEAALYETSGQLINSPAIIFLPVEEAAMELQTLAEGFGGIGERFELFAALAERRKRDYDQENDRVEAEARGVAAQATRAF